ncbi:P1 family peptidase [Halobacillus locisalis]|uniref:P1 family peptidase n=1 Tax=Halobacillus locisalis TaxID=220753 RepID=A0A838CQC0_9BACI|nr:P1 family peptidase [Halobacillus locisalis]MBA2173955.1 P1 family peptidase [Halobacillus locisalis]
MNKIKVTDLHAFQFGHQTDIEAATGCTVILCPEGAIAGVDVRGGSPGTRETDLLKSENLVENVHSVFLAGGSAFGLDVGSGVMEYLEKQGIGFDVSVARVPIVPGAILFDLNVGSAHIRPSAEMGFKACEDAYSNESFRSGNAGAGTGASVGKLFGNDYAMKSGVGQFAIQVGELQVGAVIAVNSFGDVFDPETNTMVAGLQQDGVFLNTEQQLLNQMTTSKTNRFSGNTTIGTIVTNANVTKPQANKLASIAHDGFARALRPSHTFVDGDTLFFLSSATVEVDLNALSALSTYVVERAIIDAVTSAEGNYGIVSTRDL